MIEVSLVLSIISCVGSLIFGISAYKSRYKSENKEDATSLTTVIVKLENIDRGISEIKSEIKEIKEDISSVRERLTKVEESCKQAHKRIDDLAK